MKRVLLPVVILMALWSLALGSLAQDRKSARHDELDAVIKELETNGYEAVKDKKIKLRAIQYITGTSQLTSSDKQYLDTIATFLTRAPTIVMEIGGHTDNTGGAAVNKRLSQTRANSVMQYIVSRGVIARRIKAVGYGSSQPIADNRTDDGKAQNRRVEMRFLGLTNDIYTITTKSGKKIPATYVVISSDGRTISYRENANAPLTRMPASGIDYIEYPDGSRRRPDAIVLGSGTGSEEKSAETITKTETERQSDPTSSPGIGKWLGGKFPKINRWSVIVNGGIAPLNVQQANINFGYVDESPSKDNLQNQINLKKAQFSGMGQIGFEWETDRKWLTHAQFQFGRSSQAGLSGFLVGFGKAFGQRSQWVTTLDLSLGSAYVKLGELVQNDVYILVNKTRFDSETVSIKFRNYYAAFTPQVAYNFQLKDNFTLRLTAGYSYSFHTKSVIQFKGRNADNDRVKDHEKLSASNVDFRIGQNRVTEAKLFNLRGPYATVGLLYHLYHRSAK